MEADEREERHGRRNPDNDHPLVIVEITDDQAEFKVWLQQLVASQADRIINHLQEEADHIMINLDGLKAAVARETTVDGSIRELVDQIATQLRDLIAQGTVDPAELQGLVDQMTTNSDAIAQSVTDNTPTVPPTDGTGTTPPTDETGTGTTPPGEVSPPNSPPIPAGGPAGESVPPVNPPNVPPTP